MRLLFREVEVVPGRAGVYPAALPVVEEQPLAGSTVVRLVNTTSQENAFRVQVRCAERYWQEAWFSLAALPDVGAEEEGSTAKPDQRGPNGRWVTVYVPHGRTRDILIRFHVPRTPEARAGVYPFTVDVEMQVAGGRSADRPGDRVTHLHGIVTIQPFHEWSIDLSPEMPVFRLYRPSRRAEILVTNAGNDWLYCELQLPRPGDLVLESPTTRVAVPPPEPGETYRDPDTRRDRIGTRRRIPAIVATRHRGILGEPISQPITLSAIRMDAPSSMGTRPGEQEGGSRGTVARLTEETVILPSARHAIYYPVVTGALSRLLASTQRTFQTLGASVTGLLALLCIGTVGYQHARYGNIHFRPVSLHVQPGMRVLTLQGAALRGATITAGDRVLRAEANPVRPDQLFVSVPADLAGQKLKLKATRSLSSLRFLTPMLPAFESDKEIEVAALQAPGTKAGAEKPGKGPGEGTPAKPGSRAGEPGGPPPAGGASVATLPPALPALPVGGLGPLAGPPGGAPPAGMAAGAAAGAPAGGPPAPAGSAAAGGASGSGPAGSAPAGSAATAAGDGFYHVVAGVTTTEAEARRVAQTLRREGFPTHVVATNGIYRIQTGAFRTKENAQRLVRVLHGLGQAAAVTGGPAGGTPPAAPNKDYTDTVLAQLADLRHGRAVEFQARAQEMLANTDAILQLDPGNTTVRIARAWVMVLAGRRDEGKRMLDQAIVAEPQNPLALAALAEYCYLDADARSADAEAARTLRSRASTFARMALMIKPNCPQAQFVLAQVLYRSGQNARAKAACDLLVSKLDPDLAAGFLLRARVLAAGGDAKSAQADVERAAEMDPTLPGVRELKAQLAP